MGRFLGNVLFYGNERRNCHAYVSRYCASQEVRWTSVLRGPKRNVDLLISDGMNCLIIGRIYADINVGVVFTKEDIISNNGEHAL